MSSKPFPGFPAEALNFFRQLRDNNSREWFLAHKSVYELKVRTPGENFADEVAERLEIMTGIAHEPKQFRIHRDVRFSKDKSPYHSHLHISFAPRIQTRQPPMWMFGLSPAYLTIGCGHFSFDKPSLENFRARIADGMGKELADLLQQLKAGGARIGEPELKRIPAGFTDIHPCGDLLRRKSLMAWIDLDEPQMAESHDIVVRCMEGYKRLLPLYKTLSIPVC